MTIAEKAKHASSALAYWVQWALLEIYGPASQDEAHDPIEELKRKYGKPSAYGHGSPTEPRRA